MWLVSQAQAQEALWIVSTNGADHMQVVAAESPVCPRCGTDLLTVVEREGGIGGDIGAETGPLFDFARSLP
jgi:hypothetical protein